MKDLNELVVARGPGAVRALAATAREVAADGFVWERPVPLEATPPLPPFPVDALPPWLRAFALSVAAALQTPVELPGVLGLTVVATAVAKRYLVSPKKGWREPLNLFAAVVLDPANRKSAAFHWATAPLIAWETEEQKKRGPEIARAEEEKRVLEERLKEARKLAASSKATEAEREASAKTAGDLATKLAAFVVPTAPRAFTDDCTPERLAGLISEHGGRFALLSPEGGIFETLGGRYSDGAPSLDVFLKGHAGDPLRVDRIGRKFETVNDPALTVSLTIQESVLRGLAEKPAFRDRGLLGRFLWSIPRSPLGLRASPYQAPGLEGAAMGAYRTRVRDLLALPAELDEAGQPRTLELTLSPEAQQVHEQLHHEVEPELAEGGSLAHMRDWAGKLLGAAARIAGSLHLADNVGERSWGPEIGPEAMARACDLARYFLAHARAAYAELGADPRVAQAKKVLAWVRLQGRPEFTKREVWRGVRGSFKVAEELDGPLALLVEHHFLRQIASPAGPKAGRPSVTFQANPGCRT